MRWRREIDYHGSRAYAAEDAPPTPFIVGFARIVESVRRALRKLGREPSEPTVLVRDGRHSFSLLGVDKVRSGRRAAECSFPLKADAVEP